MTYSLTLRLEALADVASAKAWYESQSPGLGDEFIERLEEVFEELRQTPLLHGIVYRNRRAAPLTRFPYIVYYEVVRDRVIVFAVLYAGRDPSTWQSRGS